MSTGKKKAVYVFAVMVLTAFLTSTVCSADWEKTKGRFRYFDSATEQYVKNRWKKIDGKWYYFNKNGFLLTGRFKLDGKFYYVEKAGGRAQKQLVGKYYYGKNGVMLKNAWKVIEGKRYYFGSNGKMKTGRFTVGSKTYYSTVEDGCVKNKRVGDYYYNSNGVMVKDRWVSGFYYGKNGKVQFGKFTIAGKTYFCLPESGIVKQKWYNGNYYDADGVMATNCWIGKGDYASYVDANGDIVKGNKHPKDPPTNSEIRLLAALVYYEAGNQPYEGKVAVASVVVNRMQSSRFPNTLRAVIYQEGQFTPAMNGTVTWLYQSGQSIQSECMKAAKLVLTEGSKYKGYYYFNSAGGKLKIGDHYFTMKQNLPSSQKSADYPSQT